MSEISEETIRERMELYDGLPSEWRALVADYGLALIVHLFNETDEDLSFARTWLRLNKLPPVRACRSRRRRI